MNWKLIFVFLVLFSACKKEEDDNPQLKKLSQDQIESILQMSVPGYTINSESHNAPATYFYSYVGANQTRVNVTAAAAVDGNPIVVNDFVINANFLNPSGIEKRTVNGIDIYEKQDGDTWSSVLFIGQYRLQVTLLNQAESIGRTEGGKFATELASKAGSI